MSENHKIGVLPPGPISNHTLMSVRFLGNPKEKLEINKDYKSLRKEIWDKFYNIYQGGPEIVRKE